MLKQRPHLISFTLYTILTLILTYPVPFQLARHIAGFAGEDNLQWRWYLWWFPHAILTLQQPVSQVSLLFAPTGGEQPLYNITQFLPALALPLTLAFGATVSFNLMVLLAFILTGYTTYLLVYYLLPPLLIGEGRGEVIRPPLLIGEGRGEVIRPPLFIGEGRGEVIRPPLLIGEGRGEVSARACAAFLAGLIFTFYPAHFGYATGTFLGQISVYLLPLYLLALIRLTQSPTPPATSYVLFLISAVLLLLTWPLHVAYGVLPLTAAYLAQLIYQRKFAPLIPLFMALTLTGLLILPFYYPLLASVLSGQQKHLGGETATLFSVDLLAFITPSNHHPILEPLDLLPSYTAHVLRDYNDIQEKLAYLGVIPCLLALLAWRQHGRKLVLWLGLAVITMLLSLGPLLKFNGEIFQLNIEGYVGYIILPYALLRGLPIIDWSAVLGRLNVMTMLCLAIMAGHGAYALLKIASPRIGGTEGGRTLSNQAALWGVTVLLSLLILTEYLTIFPFPMEIDHVPSYYTQLAELGRTEPQKIIDLPIMNNFSNNYNMHYQTVHQQPILGGHFMRTPAGTDEMKAFIQALLSPPHPPLTPPDSGGAGGGSPVFNPPSDIIRQAFLTQLGFTQIIAHPALMTDPADQAQLAYLSQWLGQPQTIDEVTVFKLPFPDSQLPIPNSMTLLMGDSWHLSSESNQIVLTETARLAVYITPPLIPPLTQGGVGGGNSELGGSLALSLSAPTADRYLTLHLDGRPLSRLYLTTELLHYNVPLSLTVGAHEITFHPEESCRTACAPVMIQQLAVTPPLSQGGAGGGSLSRSLSQPVAPIQLRGYELTRNEAVVGQPFLIYLYWQSQQRTDQNLSAFVQLTDGAGKSIAQADYLLGGWLYPTSAWSVGQMAAMPTLFFIPPNTPPGRYKLQVGIYQAETGQRLSNIQLTELNIITP